MSGSDGLRDYLWVLGPDGRTPRPATLLEWADMRSSADRFLWRDEVDGIRIITAFHGEDPWVMVGGEREPQLVFGTLITAGGQEVDQMLYATYAEAEIAHRWIVERARQIQAEYNDKRRPKDWQSLYRK